MAHSARRAGVALAQQLAEQVLGDAPTKVSGLAQAQKPKAGVKRARAEPTRRSSRVPGGTEKRPGHEDGADQTTRRAEAGDAASSALAKPAAPPAGPRTDAPAGSSRASLVQVDQLVSRWLGQCIPFSLAGSGRSGKAAAVIAACGGKHPKFNRMSGITEFANGIILWVNLPERLDEDSILRLADAGPSGYANLFTRTASHVHMQWFAQARQHRYSPAITRLLSAWEPSVPQPSEVEAVLAEPQVAAALSESSAPPLVLLFARFPNEPYFFGGRCAAVKVDLDASPIRFEWRLLDAEHMDKHSSIFAAATQGADHAP